MFESFYEFTNTPFSRSVPTQHLYMNRDHDEILNRLLYAVNNRLFAVLIGDCGVGKTTALRRLRDDLSDSKYRVLYLSESKLSPRTFYKELLAQLGFEGKSYVAEAKRQFHREIDVMKNAYGVSPVVIVDEAHLLPRNMLEEVRFILNFNMDSDSPMALILSGQSELWDNKLRLQSFTAIRQRIDVSCVLANLDRPQSSDYIHAHLRFAGSSRDIFSESAIDEIFNFSAGTPRLINKICSNLLLFGAQNKKNIIDDHMVKLVVDSEFGKGTAA